MSLYGPSWNLVLTSSCLMLVVMTGSSCGYAGLDIDWHHRQHLQSTHVCCESFDQSRAKSSAACSCRVIRAHVETQQQMCICLCDALLVERTSTKSLPRTYPASKTRIVHVLSLLCYLETTMQRGPAHTLHMLYSGGKGEKYQVSISYLPSSVRSTFFTLVNSSCSLRAFWSNSACPSSSSCTSSIFRL